MMTMSLQSSSAILTEMIEIKQRWKTISLTELMQEKTTENYMLHSRMIEVSVRH
jgi:hypothetical protein